VPKICPMIKFITDHKQVVNTKIFHIM